MKTEDLPLLIPSVLMTPDAPRLAKIGQDGVSFKSHLDGSVHYITPEKSIQIQHNLGADIILLLMNARARRRICSIKKKLYHGRRWAEEFNGT